MLDLKLKNGLVFIEGAFMPVSVGVKEGKIVCISEEAYMPDAKEVLDLSGQYIIPGTIDTHMHVRDPGHVERGNFYTETLAAAAGCVTTIMEHPISVPPQYSIEILNNRIQRADTQCVVDYCFYGAASAKHAEHITKLADDGRIVAFKTFLHSPPNGREEEFEGLTMADDAELLVGMQELKKSGLLCAYHAENNELIDYYAKKFRAEGRVHGKDHSLARPVITEVQSVERVLRFAKETGARTEIAHVSTPEAMELICNAKKEGLDVYLETCPHYLFLTDEDLERVGAFAKCNPPVRSKEIVEKLWDYVNDGSVDYIGSDHSPFLLEEKLKGKDDIFQAVSGFPGVDLRLPLMLNAVSEKKVKLERVVELLCTNPAKVFNIYPQKGVIQIGSDADFAIFNLDHETIVDKNKCYSKAKDIAVPYDGRKLQCELTYTILRGKILMKNGIVDESTKAYGELVRPVKK
ncbi:MAG: allantoinase AllB [Eubacteriales bacterium]